jgi:hypothetical protein
MTDYNNDLFNGGDFVFNRMIDEKTGESTIVGGGYKINSFFLQGGIPAMTTLNSSDQTGGKVSSPFENLAVPAGLFYINQRVPKNDLYKPDHHYKEHEMLSDDMIDKLFGLVEADNKKKRKTRKHINKSDKKKSRKRH